MSKVQNFAVETLKFPPADNFIHMLHDLHSNRIAVIDPAWSVKEIIAKEEDLGGTITDILLTHSHADHINAVDLLVEYSHAHVHIMSHESACLAKEFPNQENLRHLDTISLGKTLITCLHTPGHTPGSSCYSVEGHLFSGDTLFINGCGRCDFKGSSPEQMYHSLHFLTGFLSADTLIHPGHDYGITQCSTIQEQIDGNPYLQCSSLQDFIEYRMHGPRRKTPYTPVYRPSVQDSDI